MHDLVDQLTGQQLEICTKRLQARRLDSIEQLEPKPCSFLACSRTLYEAWTIACLVDIKGQLVAATGSNVGVKLARTGGWSSLVSE